MRTLFFLCVFTTSLFAAKPNVLLIMADDLRDFGGAFTKDVVKKIADEHGANIKLSNVPEGGDIQGAQVSLSFAVAV